MKDKIINRIKKLLALSKSNNPNEAKIAIEKARALMDSYDIKTSELIEQGIETLNGRSYKAKNVPDYIGKLTWMVCDLFQCEHYWITESDFPRRKHVSSPVFVGYEPNLSICSYVYDNLLRRLMKARKSYWGNRIQKYNYALGWVEGVRRSVRHLVPEKIEIEVSGEQGLIKINPLKRFIEDMKLEEMGTTSKGLSEDSMYEGYVQGMKEQIHKPIDGSGLQRLCLQ